MHHVRCVSWPQQGFCIGEVGVINAIPKKLLIHTVTRAIKSETDRWGNTELVNGQRVQHVRMEPSNGIVRDKNSAEIQLVATLFYDCKNSRPKGIDFVVDDIIIFNGQKYQAKLVIPFYDGEKLHHYELELMAYA
ncbi:putative minor capsid protein [Blautia producta]|uniref:putative minor capsid protein n=1 Tax=Blautia producta TaxID=33035 RepID=UPI0031B5FFA2